MKRNYLHQLSPLAFSVRAAMDDSFPEDYLEDDRSGTSDPEVLSAEETIEVDDAPPEGAG